MSFCMKYGVIQGTSIFTLAMLLKEVYIQIYWYENVDKDFHPNGVCEKKGSSGCHRREIRKLGLLHTHAERL